MFILEILLTIFYFVIIIIILALILAFAIPLGALYFVYWILFRSWRTTKVRRKHIVDKSKFYPKDIKDIVRNAIRNKDIDSDKLEKDINDYVEEAIDSANVNNKDKSE